MKTRTAWEDEAPDKYIETQFRFNTLHTDGRKEHEDESVYKYTERFREYLQGESPESIIDVGCRLGYATRRMQRYWANLETYCVDVVPQSLAEAPQKRILADISNWHPEKTYANWAFCVATLEHAWNVENAARCLLQIANKGVYVVTDLEEDFGNPSHFACTTDPLEWVELFNEPPWTLRKLEVVEEGKAVEFIMERE